MRDKVVKKLLFKYHFSYGYWFIHD